MKVRVSLGTAIVLGLIEGKVDAAPTTAYVMTYRRGKCTANCGFCPQAREGHSKAEMLSRVSWPIFPVGRFLDRLENAVKGEKIRRVCVQALNYPDVFTHLSALVNAIEQRVKVPVSVSCQPLNGKNIERLAEAGVERIGIPLDAATEELFDKVKGLAAKGPYRWESQFRLFDEAVRVFGKERVSTHLIVGLGETEKEMICIVQKCVDRGILPALFAFTSISGTKLENRPQPRLEVYRRIQIARHLILSGISRFEDMHFDSQDCVDNFGIGKNTLMNIVRTEAPFRTSGCPDCNRPYYNEKPSGPLYNYPKRISREELYEIERQLGVGET
jgi:biotin synthase